ncbi:hypothetical protein MCOR34_006119, partial [Pyricularia oryzae]
LQTSTFGSNSTPVKVPQCSRECSIWLLNRRSTATVRLGQQTTYPGLQRNVSYRRNINPAEYNVSIVPNNAARVRGISKISIRLKDFSLYGNSKADKQDAYDNRFDPTPTTFEASSS